MEAGRAHCAPPLGGGHALRAGPPGGPPAAAVAGPEPLPPVCLPLPAASDPAER